jgi:pilus assembly protein CpaB
MNKNVLIVLGGGVMIAIVVAMLMSAALRGGGKKSDSGASQSYEVLVATMNLSPGTNLSSTNTKWVKWADTAVYDGMIKRKPGEKIEISGAKAKKGKKADANKEINNVEDAVADAAGVPTEGDESAAEGEKKESDLPKGLLRRSVVKGEPITKAALAEEGKNFIAASLRPGMRAMAIKVKAEDIVGGLAGPGDFVDLILTYKQKIKPGAGDVYFKSLQQETINMNINQTASETILRNIRVMAVDQTAFRKEGEEEGGKATAKSKVGKTVTLEVSPHQAEILALGVKMGTLTLALRSLGDKEIPKVRLPVVTDERVTHIYDEVSDEFQAKLKKKSGTSGDVVRIYSGSDVSDLAVR